MGMVKGIRRQLTRWRRQWTGVGQHCTPLSFGWSRRRAATRTCHSLPATNKVRECLSLRSPYHCVNDQKAEASRAVYLGQG